MSRFPEYSFSNPIALQLLNTQIQSRGYIKPTSDAFFYFLHSLQSADRRIEIIVKNGDTTRGTNITVRLSGRTKVIIWIDLVTRIICKIDRNEKPLSSFPLAKSCTFHNNCGYDGVAIELNATTWKTALNYTLLAYGIKLATGNTSSAPILPATHSALPTVTTSLRASTLSASTPPEPQLPTLELPSIEDFELLPNDPDFFATEGKEYYIKHRAKERNRKIVIDKKKQALKSDPLLHCEACQSSFVEKYGDWGKFFAEVHHKTPLSSLTTTTETRLEDLAIVCSNCHSMLHRLGHRTLSIAELKQIISTATHA